MIAAAFAQPVPLLALLVKLAAVTLWSSVLARRIPGRLAPWLHAWLAVQVAQTAVLLTLSAFHGLSRTAIWVWLLVLLASSLAAYLAAGERFRRPTLAELLVCIAVGAPFALWIFRCMVLPDFSSDGQAYGTARIAMWMNYRTVFVHMPTIMVNLFASEWNGELNAMLYAIAAGALQGEMMGNAEILIVAAFASMWVARRFGAPPTGAILVGLLMATTPAFVGLAALTKGDLLACVGSVMAIGVLAGDTTLRTALLALVWMALAGGAKIAVLPGCLIVGAYAIWKVRREVSARELPVALLALGVASLFLFRFIANVFVYRHPFVRVVGEAANPGLDSLVRNVALIGERFVGFFSIHPDGQMYATSVAGGLGFAGWIAVAGLLRGAYRPTRSHAALALLCVVAALVSAFIIPSYVWSFRYFLPFVAAFAVMALAAAVPACMRGKARFALVPALVVFAYADFASTFVPGDISAPGGIRNAAAIIGRPYVQMGMTVFQGVIPELEPALLDVGPPKTIVVFNQLAALLAPFAGSHAQNRLYLADSQAEFVRQVREHRPDLAVLAGLPTSLPAQFPVDGYQWIAGGEWFNIAVPVR